MKKKENDKNISEQNIIENDIQEKVDTTVEETKKQEASNEEEKNKIEEEIDNLKSEIQKKEYEAKENFDRLQRLAAEFDNYKRRVIREKENTYNTAVIDVVSEFLPVVDNMERALSTTSEDSDKCIVEGVQMIMKQVNAVLDKLNIKKVDSVGTTFDPQLHNAVMHIEDESYGENEVVEEFQKGYIYKDDVVVRHSMVKVAN